MDIRNDRGGFSAAEGCMFAAVGLFVLLLVVLLTLAVLRARNPPESMPPPGRMGQGEQAAENSGVSTGFFAPATSAGRGAEEVAHA